MSQREGGGGKVRGTKTKKTGKKAQMKHYERDKKKKFPKFQLSSFCDRFWFAVFSESSECERMCLWSDILLMI